jgi:hypothetical protein
MKSLRLKPTPWIWITLPLVVLLTIAASAGAFSPSTYANDAPFFATQGVAQDAITLFITVPLMVICFLLDRRGSTRARILWLGLMAYTLYSYILYAFFVSFNWLFLIYALILGLSLYGFVGTLRDTDSAAIRDAVLDGRANADRFRRRTAVILFIIAGLFYLLWLSEIIPALVSGITPQSVLDNGLPTNPVHVLDLAILLPGLILTGIMVLKKKPLGYLLAPVFFGYAAMLGLAILAMVILMAIEGYPPVIPQVVIFALMTLGNGYLLVNYLKSE